VAIAGWIVDKSAAARAHDPRVGPQLLALTGTLLVCPIGELEQLFSARSADDYDARRDLLRDGFESVAPPGDVFDRALLLQHDLAHHHGMWHRTPVPDLLIAETALHHGLGIVHVDGDYERIAEIRPLTVRRLG
jgi:predicted nucleic acid-binding protein